MNFIIFINNGEDYSKSIVQSISFHNELSIGNLVSEDGSRGKYLLERVESTTIREIKLLENIFPDEVCQ